MSALEGPLLGITPKMYRHFAIITIALSGTIAMFADGDRRTAIADDIAQRQQKAELKREEAKKFGPSEVGTLPQEGGSWGTDSQGGFGNPIDTSGANGGSAVFSNSGGKRAPIMIEVDPKLLAKMTPEQRAAYLKKLEEERQRRMAEEPAPPSQAQIDNLIAASAQRSGSDSGY